MNIQGKLLTAVLVFISTLSFARTDYLTLPAGRSEVFELGFSPKGRKIIGKELVTVSLRDGVTTATITAGEAMGTCQVEFIDAGGGEGILLNVEVVGDLDDTLRSLRKWLGDFTDLELRKGKSKIAITGTIGTPAEWAKFQRIISLEDFKDKVEAVVEFSVDISTINKLRKELIAEGVPLVDAGKRPEEGQVAMEYSGNVLKFFGSVYAAEDVQKIYRVLKGHSWLEIVNEPKGAATSTVAQAVINVQIDDALLELGVAFVKVSKTASKNIGAFDANGAPIGGVVLQGIWNGFYDFITGDHSHNGADNFRINASLDQTLTMLAGNGVSREKQYGTIRFHANGDAGKVLHLGGTLKITPPASGDGAAPEPQDYDYGFKIINKNSRRINVDIAEADVEVAINGYPEFSNVGGAVSVNQQKRSVSPTVRIPLGQTVAVAGYEKLLEETTTPSGTPLLRNIPILNWFVAGQGEKYNDETLLFLVSIRKVDSLNEKPMVPNTPMKDITVDANTSNSDRIKSEKKKKRRWWNPFSWF